jgi:hypothetical protein
MVLIVHILAAERTGALDMETAVVVEDVCAIMGLLDIDVSTAAIQKPTAVVMDVVA